MADQWDFDPENDNDDGNQGENSLPNAARAHMRKLKKENEDLKKRVDEFLANQRTANVAEKVKAKGYDPLVASLIPSAVEGDAIDKWLDEHSKVLAKLTPEDVGEGAGEGEGGVTGEQAAALGMITSAATQGVTPAKPNDLLAQMNDPNLTKDKLDAILRSQGAKI